MQDKQNLAGFDMVLSLSQSTINYQFQQLFKRKHIHNQWNVLVGNVLDPKGEKPFHLEGEEDDLKKKIDQWMSLQSQISEAQKADNWEEVGKLVSKLKSEGLNFDFAWQAKLKPPTIEFINKDTQNVTLEINFSSGTLYYRPGGVTSAISTYEVNDWVYSFTCPIGRLKIKKSQMLMDADDEMELILRNSGLSESDFRIESLFLNFENANISNFDKSKSKFSIEDAVPLQIAIESYFNQVLPGTDHPYVLGYGVTRPKINSQEAMFQPTSLEYSTSFSEKINSKKPVPGQYSGFNFLMMLHGKDPVKSQNTGILSTSLIELGKDSTSTTDGVFAIQKSHFKDYLTSLDSYVASIFSEQKDVEVENGGFQQINDLFVMKAHCNTKHIDDEINTTYTLVRMPIENVDRGIKVTYQFKVNIDVHIHIGKWDIYDVTLSTSGKYTYGNQINKPGKTGIMEFTIINGEQGRFDLENGLEAPIIAFDKNTSIIGDTFLSALLDILMFIFAWPLKIVQGIVNQIAVDLGKENVNIQNQKIEELRQLDMLNQTNKVILPLGKTYAYKNLRLLEDKSLVAYDISYAPVLEKQS